MSKMTMTFNLPDDKSEFTLALHGGDFWSTLWELDQYLRGVTKYGDAGESTDPDYVRKQARIDAFQEIRDSLHRLLGEKSVSLDCVS